VSTSNYYSYYEKIKQCKIHGVSSMKYEWQYNICRKANKTIWTHRIWHVKLKWASLKWTVLPKNRKLSSLKQVPTFSSHHAVLIFNIYSLKEYNPEYLLKFNYSVIYCPLLSRSEHGKCGACHQNTLEITHNGIFKLNSFIKLSSKGQSTTPYSSKYLKRYKHEL
jgi:hypothetical protein